MRSGLRILAAFALAASACGHAAAPAADAPRAAAVAPAAEEEVTLNVLELL